MATNSLCGANTIVLKSTWSEGGSENDEGVASGTLLPGMNVGMTTAVETIGCHTFAPASSDQTGAGTAATGSRGNVRLVKEDALQGKTVADAYVNGERVSVHNAMPNDIVQVLVASGQTVVKGAGLSAGANGKWTVDTTLAAVEAIEASAGALGADTLVRGRVL